MEAGACGRPGDERTGIASGRLELGAGWLRRVWELRVVRVGSVHSPHIAT